MSKRSNRNLYRINTPGYTYALLLEQDGSVTVMNRRGNTVKRRRSTAVPMTTTSSMPRGLNGKSPHWVYKKPPGKWYLVMV